MAETVDDTFQAQAVRVAAGEIKKWFVAAQISHKSLASLTAPELEAIAVAAISGWIVALSMEARDRIEERITQAPGHSMM